MRRYRKFYQSRRRRGGMRGKRKYGKRIYRISRGGIRL